MVQSWIRQALRASGVAILVPAAIVAALALSVVGGGHGVGSLNQVLAGPAVPPAEAATPGPAPPRRDERTRTAAAAATATAPASGPRHHAPQPPVAFRRPVATVPDRPHRRPIGVATPQPAPPAPAPPPGQSQPSPRPIHDAGTAVAETVRPLPVAGPVAADAVQAVVDLVDSPAQRG